jgi:hypothetical protein
LLSELGTRRSNVPIFIESPPLVPVLFSPPIPCGAALKRLSDYYWNEFQYSSREQQKSSIFVKSGTVGKFLIDAM